MVKAQNFKRQSPLQTERMAVLRKVTRRRLKYRGIGVLFTAG